MTENIETILKDIVATRLDVPIEDIKPEASFIEDLGADSLDIVDLAMAIEDKFKLQIKDADYLHLTRLVDAVAYVTGRVNAPPAPKDEAPLDTDATPPTTAAAGAE